MFPGPGRVAGAPGRKALLALRGGAPTPPQAGRGTSPMDEKEPSKTKHA